MLLKIKWDYAVLDESQAIKNPNAKVSKATYLIEAKNRVALSGTPMQNNTFDIYSQMHFLNPGMLGNKEFFKEIFACEFDEDDTGKLGYIKETVGHTIKTQKLFMIGKGVSPMNGDAPEMVNEVFEQYRIPFRQMVFLGDGQTDIPALSLINRYGGTSIAVYREEKNDDGTIDEARTLNTYQKGYELAIQAGRAEQLLPADYSAGKPLKMALLGEVERLASICESFRIQKI